MKKNINISTIELQRQHTIRQIVRERFSSLNMTYFIETYGCQMNDLDSQKLSGMLEQMGFTKAQTKDEADLILFNTCCVREHAELKVFGNIGALKKQKEERPGLIIGVCGCMMQQQEVAKHLFKRFPFVDIVFGTHQLHRFGELLLNVLEGNRSFNVEDSEGEIAEGLPVERGNGFSTNLTIMYGCNNFCSYCIVPYVRGRERSRTTEDILQEAKALAKQGFLEVTLLGQNVNSYRAPDKDIDFPGLLAMLNEVEGIERIRFMSSHPKDMSDGLIDAMANLDKVCNHIHLALQSGSNDVLQRMNRRYTAEHYLNLLEKLRAKVKDVEVTTDIIVGFPGETEQDFQQTIDVVKKARFSAAYTFMYSPRKGTKAAAMEEQVPQEVKKDRLYRLNEVLDELTRTTNDKYVGSSAKVLVEGVDARVNPKRAYGKMTNFKMVYFDGDESLLGKIVPVRITGTQNNSLIGEQVQ